MFSKFVLCLLLVLCVGAQAESQEDILNITDGHYSHLTKDSPQGSLDDDMDEFSKEEIVEEMTRTWDYISNYMSKQQNFLYVAIVCMILVIWRDWEKLPFIMGFWEAELPEEVDDFPTAVTDGSKHYFPGDLVRPLHRMEKLFAVGGIFGSFGTNQAIWIRSKQEINPKIMEDSMRILTRKYPQLQMCLALKNFSIWFKRMSKVKINFEYSYGDGMKEYENSLDVDFSCWKGPLWNTRLVICPPEPNSEDGRDYRAVLIFKIHHSITDATTNNLFCREAVSIYNKLILGGTIAPIPVPLSPPVDNKYPTFSGLQTLWMNIHMFYVGVLQKHVVRCLSPKWYRTNKTRFAHDSLTQEETDNLLAYCKKNKVTVNSCVMTASAYAFHHVIDRRSKSISDTPTQIEVAQAVNIRRFLDEKRDLNGCYISYVPTLTTIDPKKPQDFWDEAMNMQKYMKTAFESDLPLKYGCLFDTAWVSYLLSMLKFVILQYQHSEYHYISTNMNDITEQLPEASEKDDSEIHNVMRTVSGAHCLAPFYLTFHTYRKIMRFSIDIYTNKTTEEAGNQYFSHFMNVMRYLSRNGSLPT